MPGRGRSGKRLVREVLGGFLGGQVKVGEDHDPGRGMLEHLGAPAGMGPGMKPFAKLKAERGEHLRSRGGRTAASSGRCDGRGWPSPARA